MLRLRAAPFLKHSVQQQSCALFARPFAKRAPAFAMSSTFTLDPSLSRYASASPDGKLPPVPRIHGVCTVTSGAAAAGATLVRLVPKAELPSLAAAGGGGLAAEDAKSEGVLVTYPTPETRVLLSALAGKKLDAVRKAAAAAVAKARALKVAGALAFELPSVEGLAPADVAGAIAQAAAGANYAFSRYMTGAKAPHVLPAISVACGGDAAAEASVALAAVLAEAVVLARDCGNERADEMNCDKIEAVAKALAAETGMAFFSLVGEELLAAGMHMHYSVGQGARYPPRYVELFHAGDPEHPEDKICIVGKGICFDSGGLNIKGTGYMEDMHLDKAGASNVLGIALATGRLKIKRNVVFVLAVAENAVDAKSFKPHNIMRSKKGITVTNSNTDAEGRLVLGDSLYAVQERHRPHTIIDMATLTGACVVALGEYCCGAFSNSAPLTAAVAAAGAARGELLWPMPVLAEHRAELAACAFADIKSTGASRYGGACVAAGFLQNFIGLAEGAAPDAATYKPSFLHLDIAGVGMIKGAATSFGTLTCIEYLLKAPAGAAFQQDEE